MHIGNDSLGKFYLNKKKTFVITTLLTNLNFTYNYKYNIYIIYNVYTINIVYCICNFKKIVHVRILCSICPFNV